MHAGWNLLVRHQRANDLFLRISFIIAVVGFVPAFVFEFIGAPVIFRVGGWACLGGAFLAVYYFGLSRGYRGGDFTVVYPLVRAIPVLLVALTDLARGNPPSALGWLGLVLVAVGCFIIPLRGLNEIQRSHYLNRSTAWILLAALGSVGYSTVDSIAAQSLQAGLETAIRYNIYESSFTLMIYFLILRAVGDKGVHAAGWDGWKWPVVAAGFLFGAYSLVLWAFQLDPHASYIVALRQFSIVIGVATGAMFFHEPAPWLRAFASVVILIGVLCIAFAK